MRNLPSKLKKSGILLLLISMILFGMVFKTIPLALAQVTEIVVENPLTGDGNFIFFSDTTPVGWRFNASVWVYDVTDLYSYQVKLYVNDTLLNITRAWRGQWDSSWIFYGQSTVGLAPAYYDLDSDGVVESVLVGDSLMGTLYGVSGSGLLAIIEFQIIYEPPVGTVSCALNINNADTYPLDSNLEEMTVTKTDGYYEYNHISVPPTASFTYSPSLPSVGEPITFNASLSQANGGSIVNYTWNFDDGTPETTETDPIIEHTYTSGGTYNVTLTIFDTEGLSDTTWQEITVTAGAPAFIVEPDYYQARHRGEVFNVTIKIQNVDASLRMVGIQFRLRYNLSLVEVVDMIEGDFLPSFPQDPTPPHTYFMAFDEPNDILYGTHVVIGDLLLPNDTGYWPGPFPEGDGVLAIITFRVTGVLPGTFDFELFDTMLMNDDLDEIPHEILNEGEFELYALTVTITDQPQAAYGRLSIASMKFVVRYPNGSYYTASDFYQVKVRVYDGTSYLANISLTTANFDAASNKWTVEWQIPRDASLDANYTFVILQDEIIDNRSPPTTGPLADKSSNIFKVLSVVTLDVKMDVGSIHFKGEKAEFSILTLLDGKRFGENATQVTATLYKPDGTTQALTVTCVTIGFFKATYTIPVTDVAGTYTLIAEVSFITATADYSGAAIASFLVSPTLTEWDPMIRYINGTTATIVTKLGEIQLDLQDINATLASLIVNGKGEILAQISSAVGTITTKLDAINATLVDLLVNGKGEILAQISYYLGSAGTITAKLDGINATIVAINGNVLTINTTIGTVEKRLEDINVTIVAINGTVATLNTAFGPINTKLDNLNANVTRIDGNVVTIKTSVGEIQTTLDEIKDSIGGAQSAATTTLYVTAPLSAIAAALAAVILLLLRKK